MINKWSFSKHLNSFDTLSTNVSEEGDNSGIEVKNESQHTNTMLGIAGTEYPDCFNKNSNRPMKKVYLAKKKLEEYIEYLHTRQLSERYIKEIKRINLKVISELEKIGMEVSPYKMREREIGYLLSHVIKGGTWNRQYEICIVNGFLKYCGNPIIKKMSLGVQKEPPRNKDWLSSEHLFYIYKHAEGIEKILFALESYQGLRRIECMRLKWSDIDLNKETMIVTGKGRMGGKRRVIPISPIVYGTINEWKAIFEANIGETDKETYILAYKRGNKIKTYKKSAVDNILRKLSNKTGIKFTHHTLRRTFGRIAWESQVPVETIAQLMGHESTSMTLEYIGINETHMKEGLLKMVSYLNNNFPKKAKKVKNEFCQ